MIKVTQIIDIIEINIISMHFDHLVYNCMCKFACEKLTYISHY